MNAQILEHPTLSQKKLCFGLASALEITESMLVMAKAGKWDSVKNLEIKRRIHLDQCLSKRVDQKDAQLVSDALVALLNLNDSLMSCVHETRDTYMQQLQGTRQAMNLAGKYLEI